MESYSGYLLSNKPRHSLILRTTHDVTLISQLETLVIVEVRECGDKCICDRVTDFLGGLRLGFHPLTECNISDVVSKTFAKCIECPSSYKLEQVAA